MRGRRFLGRAGAVATSAALALAPRAALACAVCFSATDGNRQAFLGTTIFLTLLPLTMIGTMSYVVWRRSRALSDEVR